LVAVLARVTSFDMASAAGQDVTFIPTTNYFPIVQQQLGSATGSIDIAMYYIRLTPPVVRSETPAAHTPEGLLNELVAAYERGVAVRVILDKSYRYDPVEDRKYLSTKNSRAYQYLRRAGINVRFASPDKTLHAKMVIIDRHAAIVGSANWTEAAFTRNVEASVLIESSSIAELLLADIDAIETILPEQEPPPAITMANAFILNHALAPRMVTKRDERAFDLYLLMVRQLQQSIPATEQAGNPAIELDLAEAADELGMGDMSRTAYRRQIIRTLRKLRKTYGLIEYEVEFSKNAMVTMLPVEKSSPLMAGYFNIPSEFWDYEWAAKLSLCAKFCYFINIYKTETSKTKPWWSLSRTLLRSDFDVNEWTISKGMQELSDQGILQIEYSRVGDGSFEDRAPNRYCLNPLLSPEEIEEMWEYLQAAYGMEIIAEARELAELMDMGNSHQAVQDFARLINRHGLELVRQATGEVARLRRDNPVRHIGYVVGVIERMKRGE
jgi:hypothetical protein